MNGQIVFQVPLVPPSVNHYVKHTRNGKHYTTAESRSFKDAVALYARGQHIEEGPYKVQISLLLGKSQRLDIDNGLKVSLDALVFAGVIDSDANVKELHIFMGRDWKNPKTVFIVERIE